MSFKFREAKSINVGVMRIVTIRTEEDKPFYVTMGKFFSFGVKYEDKFNTTSMSLKLDDATIVSLQGIIDQCETHLGKRLSKKVFYKDNTIYPKFKADTKLYEGADEVEPSKCEGQMCDVKAILEIGGILLNGKKTSLQLKVYEALVREHVREHIRLIGTEF